MRKFIFFLLLTIGSFCNAQNQYKIAVLDFLAGSGTTQTDVEGLSSIFITYFNPTKCELIERTQIDNIIKEQNFQLTNLTARDIAKIGEIGNINYLVMGDVNVINGIYNIDIRVVSCETGKIITSTGDELENGVSFRSLMKNLADILSQSLDSKLPDYIQVETKKENLEGLEINVMGFYLGMPYDEAISLLSKMGSVIPNPSTELFTKDYGNGHTATGCNSSNTKAYVYQSKIAGLEYYGDLFFNNCRWSMIKIIPDESLKKVNYIMLYTDYAKNETINDIAQLRESMMNRYNKYLFRNLIQNNEFDCVFKDDLIVIGLSGAYGDNDSYYDLILQYID